jgi:hypothetical protein
LYVYLLKDILSYTIVIDIHSFLAQLAERTAVNREVAGSNPAEGVYAHLAQLVERETFNLVVGSSSLPVGMGDSQNNPVRKSILSL